jgi:WD40 repeat protein
MSSSSNSGLQGISRGFLKSNSTPHGFSIACPFFAHDLRLSDYKSANKIKTLDVHPSLSWVATADEVGNVVIWDFSSESIVMSFPAESIKDSQRAAAESLELHDKFAASQGVLSVPDVAGPGLGLGPGSPPGATVGGGNECYIASAVDSSNSTIQPSIQRWKIPDADQKNARTGNVRGVRFADEHVLTWFCGEGKGDYDSIDILGKQSNYALGGMMPLAGSIDEVDALLSSSVDSSSFDTSLNNRAHSSSLAGFSSGRINRFTNNQALCLRAPHNWIILICEHRVILLDYITRASIDIPHSSLLVEASGPSGIHRTVTKGKPGVHSASLIGAGIIAFGCEDGAIRVWSADLGAVIQVIRPHLASNSNGKPITHLFTINTSPHAGAGSTPACLSPSSPLGLAARSAQTLLICGSADGSINTYEVMGRRMLLDNGKRRSSIT